jgi:hypothetical protein
MENSTDNPKQKSLFEDEALNEFENNLKEYEEIKGRLLIVINKADDLLKSYIVSQLETLAEVIKPALNTDY